jgi:hypothetical protein
MTDSTLPASKRPRSSEEDKILVVVKHNDSWGDEHVSFWSTTTDDPKKLRSLFYLSPADRKTEFELITLHSGPLTHIGKTVCLAIDDDDNGEDTSSDDE